MAAAAGGGAVAMGMLLADDCDCADPRHGLGATAGGGPCP